LLKSWMDKLPTICTEVNEDDSSTIMASAGEKLWFVW
jgi:hypothetical protein